MNAIAEPTFKGLKESYELFHILGICTKHTTHDSTFYIIKEGDSNYCVIKFYDGDVDYRSISGFDSLAIAYSMALCAI